MVRRQRAIDDGSREIKMVASISVAFSVNMGRQHACLLSIYFLIDC